jgi:sugar phosphate isomerase/epimerase
MYKNLNAAALGISGRQSELIELAMTFGFQGLDVDGVDLEKRSARTDFERASRFLLSSKLHVSGFEVPVDLDAEDSVFDQVVHRVDSLVSVMGRVGARAGIVRIPAATNRNAFPQYFEWIRGRIDRLASAFEKQSVILGLEFTTYAVAREGKQYAFVQDVDGAMALFKACSCKSVGLVVDTFDWTVGKGTWEQLAELSGSRVAAFRIADLSDSPSVPSNVPEARMIAGTTGKIDNARFAKALHAQGYQGPITSYPSPSNLGTITRDTIVSRAQEVLDETLTKAGLPTHTRRPDLVVADQTDTNFDAMGVEA